jgi:hypothetical protein
MLKKCKRQHGHKRRHVKEIHTSAWTQKKACYGNSYVSIDTKEGMVKKCIRQHRHKRRHVKEIHMSASTQKKAW